MKNTIIVNNFGGPGAGKSTIMALVFGELKKKDVDCDQVTEFAKDLVWERRDETFKDEIYIFSKQEHRIFRLNGKVDVIITDRPLLLTCLYSKENPALSALCEQEFNRYHNLNYLIHRAKKYNPNGRNQTEDEAVAMDAQTEKMLNEKGVAYKKVEYKDAVDIIVRDVLEELDKIKKQENSSKDIVWDEVTAPHVNEDSPLPHFETNIYDDECRICKMGFTRECKNCHRLQNMLRGNLFKNIKKDENI